MYLMPTFDAIQVVPQSIDTTPTAKRAVALFDFFLLERPLFKDKLNLLTVFLLQRVKDLVLKMS